MKSEVEAVWGCTLMRDGIEKRMHRVMIKTDKKEIVCPYAIECLSAENCNRCNEFYRKCTKFIDFISNSK